ncbi:MAG: hypothetical protein EPO32_13530 [Anaerolineae bacterium]|nr:MAG: hypothetical protein EPO32_13530 [Anaerolineae bacterium]
MTRRHLFAISGMAVLALGGFLLWSARAYGPGFPLDDSWIHQTYARNLAQRGEWSFIPGQPSAGLTAPLWALLLAPGHWLGLAPYAWAWLLGGLCLAGLGWAAVAGWGALAQSRPGWAHAAAALLVFEWHSVWAAASGMETALFSLMALAALVLLLRIAKSDDWRPWLGLGALIGLSAWVRPEGITLLVPAALAALLGSRQRQSLGALLGGFALTFVPYLLFNRWLAGAWWPNTFYAKQAEYASHREAPLFTRVLQQGFLPLVGVGIVLLPGFVYRLVTAVRRREWAVLLGAAWAAGHLALYALRLPVTFQHGRYAMPAMPVLYLWGFAGLAEWVKPSARAFGLRLFSRFALALAAAVLGLFYALGAQAYATDVGIINTEMVAAARWLAANSEPDDLIAAHDIGALGYFAPRPLLDLAGLVSPEVIPFIRDEAALAEYLDARHPYYFMTFPDWYPVLTARAELVYTTEGSVSPAAGGENMAIYRWPGP